MLSEQNNENRSFLFPVDPHMAFVYWEYSDATAEMVKSHNSGLYLILFKENSEYRRYEINDQTRNYYFQGIEADCFYRMAIVLSGPNGNEVLSTSNTVHTPPTKPDNTVEVHVVDVRQLRQRVQEIITKEVISDKVAMQAPYSEPEHISEIGHHEELPVFTDPAQEKAGVFNAIAYPKLSDYSKPEKK